MAYVHNLLVAFSQLINAIFGGNPNEMLSARAYREDRRWLVGFLNLIFADDYHCFKSFKFELRNDQLPEYKELSDDVTNPF